MITKPIGRWPLGGQAWLRARDLSDLFARAEALEVDLHEVVAKSIAELSLSFLTRTLRTEASGLTAMAFSNPERPA